MCTSCVSNPFAIEIVRRLEFTRGAFLAATAAAGVAAAALPRRARAQGAPQAVVFFNGPIVAMDDQRPSAQAVAISETTILDA